MSTGWWMVVLFWIDAVAFALLAVGYNALRDHQNFLGRIVDILVDHGKAAGALAAQVDNQGSSFDLLTNETTELRQHVTDFDKRIISLEDIGALAEEDDGDEGRPG